jgi:hypothetical protein
MVETNFNYSAGTHQSSQEIHGEVGSPKFVKLPKSFIIRNKKTHNLQRIVKTFLYMSKVAKEWNCAGLQ